MERNPWNNSPMEQTGMLTKLQCHSALEFWKVVICTCLMQTLKKNWKKRGNSVPPAFQVSLISSLSLNLICLSVPLVHSHYSPWIKEQQSDEHDDECKCWWNNDQLSILLLLSCVTHWLSNSLTVTVSWSISLNIWLCSPFLWGRATLKHTSTKVYSVTRSTICSAVVHYSVNQQPSINSS